VRSWSEDEFAAGANEWRRLLDESGADPLFMSWDWQWRWWRHHAGFLGAQLCLLAAYLPDGRLVGIAPLYRRRAPHRYGLQAPRLEFIGLAFRDSRPVFSEYLDLIVATSCERQVLAAFARALRTDGRWSDLVFANTRTHSMAALLVKEHLARDCYVRRLDILEAHATRLPARFENYIKALKSGTRRKLWNQRGRLQSPHVTLATETDIGDFLDQIDNFHRVRWGGAHYLGARRRFHLDFAAEMARRNALRMSILSVDGEPISVMYNLHLRNTEYNMQSGFSAAAADLSPGYLHFGYCVEDACTRGVTSFDFLAGSGRNRQYKQDFLTSQMGLLTLQVVRGPALRALYRVYDWMHPAAPAPASSPDGDS